MSDETTKTEKKRSSLRGTSILTFRARRMCDLIVGGMANVKAYRLVYKCPRLISDDAADRAWKIMRRPAAAAYLRELKGESKSKSLLSLNDRLEILAKDAQSPGIGPAYMSARTRAIDVYSKISGDQAPERHEISAPGGGPIQSIVTTRTMTAREKLDHMLQARAFARRQEQAAQEMKP